jgi:valyl-tRNA synthetase
LATKLLNVSKFVLGIGAVGDDARPTDPIDLSMLAKLDDVIADATAAFEGFDYARALERTESFFWWFCDDYVELVKGRGYGSRGDAGAASARAALRTALSALQRLLAPILPFATEETWSWWQSGSIHVAKWPEPVAAGGDPQLIDAVLDVLAQVRRTKTEAKLSQRAEVATLVVTLPNALHAAFRAGSDDLLEAGSITAVEVVDGEQLDCKIELAVAT